MTLAGRRILLTGAGSGIGAAVGAACLDAGATVLGVVRSPSRPALPPRYQALVADLADPADVDCLVAQALALEPDTIIQSAVNYGGAGRAGLSAFTLEDLAATARVNYLAQAQLLAGLAPGLTKKPRALIVGITSPAALAPAPGRLPYAASKAAAHMLHLGLAAELDATDITVTLACPIGLVRTRGLERRRPADFDYAGWRSPADCVPPILRAIESFGAGLHGQVFDC